LAPPAEIDVCSKSKAFGPDCRLQATCRTPSGVRAVETWSMLEPPVAVIGFQVAAPAAGTPSASASASKRAPVLTDRV
jgi:hypothetical protein